MTTHELERAQYADDVDRLGLEAWRYWEYKFEHGEYWHPHTRPPLFLSYVSYRRNPDTYPKEELP